MPIFTPDNKEYMITQKDIGSRISSIRKAKGLTQEELGKILGISRPSVTQLESGNREVSAIELQKLATALQFSIDDFLSDNYTMAPYAYIEDSRISTAVEEPPAERISEPGLNTEKFKNVLLYILERSAGKPNVGETVLYKLLYFCDFNYYEIYETHLTGARYKKLSYGPVPHDMQSIISKMASSGQLQKVKSEYFGKPQTRLLPLIKPDLTTFSAAEKDVIDSVINQMSDWSAKTISDYSHNDKPWRATELNDTIDYELAFYRSPPYSVRVYAEDEQDNI